MDVARTAFRHGAKTVTLYARSKRIAASEDEVEYAKLDGCEFVLVIRSVELLKKVQYLKSQYLMKMIK